MSDLREFQPMDPEQVRVQCSWCRTWLKTEPADAPISHSICALCAAVATGELEQYALGATIARRVLGRG